MAIWRQHFTDYVDDLMKLVFPRVNIHIPKDRASQYERLYGEEMFAQHVSGVSQGMVGG